MINEAAVPTIITGETMDELFWKVCKTLQISGEESSPRGQKTLELRNAWLTLLNPTQKESILTFKSRGDVLTYLEAEFDWYKTGTPDVQTISNYSSMWDKLADSNGTANSNYGFLCFVEKYAGKSQFEWCIKTLVEDPQSRQAVMNYNQPKHKYDGNKDFVCTLSQEFMIRNGKLDTVVHMRSNDIIYGLTFDLPWFTYVQRALANILNVPVGHYHHLATSLHVYERHYDMVSNIIKEGEAEYV